MAEQKLATFKITEDLWLAFKGKAEANDTNASAVLKAFVQRYLNSDIDKGIDHLETGIDVGIDGSIDSGLEARLEKLEREVAELRGKSWSCPSIGNLTGQLNLKLVRE